MYNNSVNPDIYKNYTTPQPHDIVTENYNNNDVTVSYTNRVNYYSGYLSRVEQQAPNILVTVQNNTQLMQTLSYSPVKKIT